MMLAMRYFRDRAACSRAKYRDEGRAMASNLGLPHTTWRRHRSCRCDQD